MNAKDLFDLQSTAIAQATRGVTIDFLRHPVAQMDADLFGDTLSDMFGVDSPATYLERTITTTGAAQTLTLDAPLLGSPNLADHTRVVGLDFAFQLNPNNIPRTDINMVVQMLNAAGVSLTAREQAITGNASIVDGNTRQYLRLISFEQNSTISATGVISPQDGKNFSLPRFQRPDAANLATVAAALGLTVAQMATVFPSLHQDIASIAIQIPAGGFAPGIVITVTPITVGRADAVSRLILSLESNKDGSGAAPTDLGRADLFKTFTAQLG